MTSAPDIVQPLEALLHGLLDTHRHLLVATVEHRDALRSASGARVEAAAERTRQILERIALLDGTRRELIARFAPAGVNQARVRLSDLAALAPDRDRDRLLELAVETRQVMASVHEEQRTIRAATEVLMAHLEGLLRQVGQSLNHARTYTRRGFVEAGAAVVSSLDVAC